MSKRFIAASVLCFAAALSAQAATVTRGPYLQLGTPASIIVRWRTDVATDSRVSYGTVQGTLTSQTDDATLTLPGSGRFSKIFVADAGMADELGGHGGAGQIDRAPGGVVQQQLARQVGQPDRKQRW